MDSSSSPDSSAKRVNGNGITDDIWSEIFLHLPLNSIFKFRCVSKVWLSILSNPYLINKWYQINYLSLPWGLLHYTAASVRDHPQKLKRFFTIAYPDSHSDFISHHQTGFSFNFLNSISQNTNLFVIGSSSGLVLCTTSNQTTYYVCNPLTQKWVLLPPTPPRKCSQDVTGFVCNDEYCSSSHLSERYKVIRLLKFRAAAEKFEVELFCSELGEWSVVHVSCPQNVTWDFSLDNNHLAHNGVLYWCQRRNRSILAVCVNRNTNDGTCENQCRLIDMPNRAMDGDDMYCLKECLGESEGLVCFARFKVKEKSLSVWVLDGDWCMLHKDIQLHDWFAEIESQFYDGSVAVNLISETGLVGFSPVDKNVVILSSEKYVWSYNIKTRVYELLSHPRMTSSATFEPRLQYFHHILRVTHC